MIFADFERNDDHFLWLETFIAFDKMILEARKKEKFIHAYSEFKVGVWPFAKQYLIDFYDKIKLAYSSFETLEEALVIYEDVYTNEARCTIFIEKVLNLHYGIAPFEIIDRYNNLPFNILPSDMNLDPPAFIYAHRDSIDPAVFDFLFYDYVLYEKYESAKQFRLVKIAKKSWAILRSFVFFMGVHKRAVVSANHPFRKRDRNEFECE